MRFHEHKELAVGVDLVREAFARYDLLDDQVRFVEGWFKDTMPPLAQEVGPIAVLRADGDMYESTIDVLTHLEPLVSPGGFAIIDDYNGIEACQQAVTDHRAAPASPPRSTPSTGPPSGGASPRPELASCGHRGGGLVTQVRCGTDLPE